MSDIIDINVNKIVEEVTINVVDNVIQVNINNVSGGGGGTQTLAQTLDLGNTTGGENISISNGDAIILDNGSMLKKGTIDAGNGGSKGISQICGVGFEHKWEAGRLYIMNDGGTIIREVSHNLTYTPTATDDVTKGFVQNTRWILDNGDLYICTDPTEGAAVWELQATQVNSDWNATSGLAEILNKPTIPTNTSDLTNDGADGVNPFITALDIPTAGTASTLVREVKNMTGATLTKGTVVYISGANGNKALVSKALATTDALSSRTFGMLQSNILNNGLGNCVIIGDLSGLDTSSFAEGAQLYLSGVTAGTYTDTKILAPTHLVYVGKVTRSHPTLGQIEVGIQNGYELSEIHDVALSSEANNQALVYESSTDLWKNKTIDKTFVGLGNVDNTSDANKPVSTAQQTAINAKVADNITDGVTTIAPSQNAVFDALALKQAVLSYTPYRNVQTSQTAHTGTTLETNLFTATIPAGAFNANDVIKVLFGINKTTPTALCTLRLRVSTTNNPLGGTLIATFQSTSSSQSAIMMRNFNLNGGNLYGVSFPTTFISDIAGINQLSSTAINPANQFFIHANIQLANASDNISISMLSIHN